MGCERHPTETNVFIWARTSCPGHLASRAVKAEGSRAAWHFADSLTGLITYDGDIQESVTR